MDKKSYLLQSDYGDLVRERRMPPMVAMSSGSSGKPFYWPRTLRQEDIGGKNHELIFRDIFGMTRPKRTLAVVCFSMGTWIAGPFTMNCLRKISEKGYGLTVMTPGIEKEDILSILKDFAPHFDVVVLAGYPPFVMDVLGDAEANAIDLKSLDIRLLLAGENFSENWRAAAYRLAGIRDYFHGSVGIYGTAEADMLGHETPLSVFLRKKAEISESFRRDLFGEVSFLPSLVQYHPSQIFFELIGGELVFTKDTGIPLVRYNIHDTGKLLSYAEARALCERHGFWTEVRKFRFDAWRLPFVSLHGRTDVAASFYALKVYPENIKNGLEDKRVQKYLTGKFVAHTEMSDDEKSQKLIIKAELARGCRPASRLANAVRKSVVENLVKNNKEYRKLHSSIGADALPRVELFLFGDPVFSVKKAKHRWIKKV